jgi:RNA polymerase sigma-70 factor (ECF subfamily)
MPDFVRMIPHAADQSLAARVRRGDADALAELYAAAGPAVMRVAYRLSRNQADAEDVLHDVFLGLPEALLRYEERGALVAWVTRLAVRTTLDRMRRGRRDVTLDAADGSPALHAAHRADAILAATTLRSALDTLSAPLRTVFVLKELEGYTHAEIAVLLDISVSASEARLSRATRALVLQLRSSR